MNGDSPLPRLPYLLLGAMTLVSFGGPFVIVGVLRGGDSAHWPPDRPIEWLVLGLILALVLVLFLACVSIRLWYGLIAPPSERSGSGMAPAKPERENRQALDEKRGC
jgi:hypothetical protein